VLGSIGSSNSWQWAAWGKHPVARDFFSVGSNAPMVKAFSDWVEKGYKIFTSKERPSSSLCSWRFWARGPKREILVCGIGRDSSDSVGRPYPLLIMGTGPLEGWEDQWDLLPFACEKTWSQMEYLSAKRFTDFEQFEDEVQIVRPPHPEWPEFRSVSRDLWESSSATQNNVLSWDPRQLEDRVSVMSKKTDFFVPLDGGPSDDPHTLAGLWHALLKVRISDVPNAVFMGGASDGTYLAVFKRALAPTDFVRLWSGAGKKLEA